MMVTFNGSIIGELQGISYTVTREVAPLYTMGSADPRSFSRGKRGIAGSLIFLVFDRSALLATLKEKGRYIANAYENPGGAGNTAVVAPGAGKVANTIAVDPATSSLGAINVPGTAHNNMITMDKVIAAPRYTDQVLPFEVVITAGNEFGHFASMVIGGCQIMNSGSGLSIDDITTDEACTFVATYVKPWDHQYHHDPVTNAGQSAVNTNTRTTA